MKSKVLLSGGYIILDTSLNNGLLAEAFVQDIISSINIARADLGLTILQVAKAQISLPSKYR